MQSIVIGPASFSECKDRGEWHGGTREEIYEVCRSSALQAALCVAFIYTHPLLFVDLSSPITISVQTSTHFTAPKKKESTLLWDHITLVVIFGRFECAFNKCHGSLPSNLFVREGSLVGVRLVVLSAARRARVARGFLDRCNHLRSSFLLDQIAPVAVTRRGP